MKRRDFIGRTLQAGAILPIASSGLLARPLSWNSYGRSAAQEDRILVLINLNGGNDGLNTVVPWQDSAYHDARRDIALDISSTLPLDGDLRLHDSMQRVADLYSDGDCAVINNVGYENQNRSHFRSTDIWHTASDAEEVELTGWLGRYLQQENPDFPETLPSAPFALQISTSTSLALQGDRGSLGIALENPERFFRLANGLSVEETPVPDTKAGPELAYVRSVIAQSDTFARVINEAMEAGRNIEDYGGDTLAQQLKIVARLIDGGLPTSVYVVSLPGFDTHARQLDAHRLLLRYLSDSVSDFLLDIRASGKADRVVAMTYSEFGRRLNQNGSYGTDHGAAAPQFLFGAPVQGGQLLGGNPDLVNLDPRGDVRHTVDYRSLYATVLERWLGLPGSTTDSVLGGQFERLPLFPASSVERFGGARQRATTDAPSID